MLTSSVTVCVCVRIARGTPRRHPILRHTLTHTDSACSCGSCEVTRNRTTFWQQTRPANCMCYCKHVGTRPKSRAHTQIQIQTHTQTCVKFIDQQAVAFSFSLFSSFFLRCLLCGSRKCWPRQRVSEGKLPELLSLWFIYCYAEYVCVSVCVCVFALCLQLTLGSLTFD